MGIVLLCEAASSELDIGKRKSTLPAQQLLLPAFLYLCTEKLLVCVSYVCCRNCSGDAVL